MGAHVDVTECACGPGRCPAVQRAADEEALDVWWSSDSAGVHRGGAGHIDAQGHDLDSLGRDTGLQVAVADVVGVGRDHIRRHATTRYNGCR